jgi:hypothetical protein
MKIKEGYILRKVMGNYMIVAVGKASKDFKKMVRLNESAAKIWELVGDGKSESEIVDALFELYEVDHASLEEDVKKTLAALQAQGFIEI